MAYAQIENRGGALAIGTIDAGVPAPVTVSNGGTTVVPSGAGAIGSIVRAVDPVLGEGEFIMLKGAVSTVVGSVVTWDSSFVTSLATIGANQARPVAVAMSANVNPANFGWYQIGGMSQMLVGATPTTANSAIGINTAGNIGPSAVGVEIEGARCLTATGAGLLATVEIDRPALQGRIT